VSIGGDGNKSFAFTSRTDVARYVSYVLTHFPSEQLKNRSFTIAADNKVDFNLAPGTILPVILNESDY